MTPFQPWGWHYRVRAPKWLAAVSLLLLSLHATTSLGLVGLETADFLERADPDRFLINNLNNIGGEEGTTLYDSALIFNNLRPTREMLRSLGNFEKYHMAAKFYPLFYWLKHVLWVIK